MSSFIHKGQLLAPLGNLAILHRELIYMIIDCMNIPTAVTFTRVNRQAQLLIWLSDKFRFVRHCMFEPNLIRNTLVPKAIYSVLAANTYRQLASVLLEPECEECKRGRRQGLLHSYMLHPAPPGSVPSFLCTTCYWMVASHLIYPTVLPMTAQSLQHFTMSEIRTKIFEWMMDYVKRTTLARRDNGALYEQVDQIPDLFELEGQVPDEVV
ncbi:hypothetical protein F5Y04DRAFT_99812 [Hypomontagnella monticulosa]|nr:hypothetical protein F5Y04DRAFT_99812 [Hypomontagnella monticulosa]